MKTSEKLAVVMVISVFVLLMLSLYNETIKNRQILMQMECITNTQIRTLSDKIDSVRVQSLRLWLDSKNIK